MANTKPMMHDQFAELSRRRLEEILSSLADVSIAVVGDGCLDVYWEADMTRSQLSRETHHFPLPVFRERMSLGAAANVAANLAALGIKRVGFLTVIGQDWRGREMETLLAQQGIDDSLVVTAKGRVTPAYCKPIRYGYGDVWYEDPRLDFENPVPLDADTEMEVIQRLRGIPSEYQGMIVADQLNNGVITEAVRQEINQLGSHYPIVVDSRERIHLYRHATLKPNHVELLKAVAPEVEPDAVDKETLVQGALELSRLNCARVLVTAGELGAIWVDGSDRILAVATKPAEPPIDPVGAGDCFISAFTACSAAGAEVGEAIFIANLAARIVVKKLRITGTATPEEILQEYEMLYGTHPVAAK